LKVTSTSIPEVLSIEPKVFVDSHGFFYESFKQKAFNRATGLNATFVQDNLSRSSHNVLRGLHYQVQNPQGKLVQVMAGEIFDVAVDLRHSSPRFGRWVAAVL
jgi:dTDP-4-dehydrorhamnose 3,5-epimerase